MTGVLRPIFKAEISVSQHFRRAKDTPQYFIVKTRFIRIKNMFLLACEILGH
jgi:hypothetical protein